MTLREGMEVGRTMMAMGGMVSDIMQTQRNLQKQKEDEERVKQSYQIQDALAQGKDFDQIRSDYGDKWNPQAGLEAIGRHTALQSVKKQLTQQELAGKFKEMEWNHAQAQDLLNKANSEMKTDQGRALQYAVEAYNSLMPDAQDAMLMEDDDGYSVEFRDIRGNKYVERWTPEEALNKATMVMGKKEDYINNYLTAEAESKQANLEQWLNPKILVNEQGEKIFHIPQYDFREKKFENLYFNQDLTAMDEESVKKGGFRSETAAKKAEMEEARLAKVKAETGRVKGLAAGKEPAEFEITTMVGGEPIKISKEEKAILDKEIQRYKSIPENQGKVLSYGEAHNMAMLREEGVMDQWESMPYPQQLKLWNDIISKMNLPSEFKAEMKVQMDINSPAIKKKEGKGGIRGFIGGLFGGD